MKARILPVEDEKKWDNFVLNHPLASINQSSTWGHFQQKVATRGKYWIIALEEAGRITAGTILILHKLPYGFTWLYSVRGPLLNYESAENSLQAMNLIVDEVRKIGKKENAVFYRIDPPLINKGQEFPVKFPAFAFSGAGFQPENTLILDISGTDEDLLAQMKPKGRYNIRLAEKKGVEIFSVDPWKEREEFHQALTAYHQILLETSERDGFYAHRPGFYKSMLEELGRDDLVKIYLARFEGEIIGGIIVTFFKDTAIYYYGASSNRHRNVMAPYLLQWKAILDAKSRGIKYYDFLGIAPKNQIPETPGKVAKDHPWKGVTEFKTKFGGERVNYFPAQELSLKPVWHLLYRLHKLRKSNAY